jgi:hypothetical protein
MGAVGNHPMAVDNPWQYRPQESPANGHINGDAGDADGTSRGSSCKTSAIAFCAVQPHRLEVFKAASNAFLAEEQGLGDVGPIEMAQAFNTACTRIEARPTGPLAADRGMNS